MEKKDNPGVFVPPPIVYVLLFLAASLLQRVAPVTLPVNYYFKLGACALFVAATVALLIAAVGRFVKSKNTLITVRPANSLQTTGIYAITRNPMYLGLALLYTGVALLIANWWAIILLPVLVLIVTLLIIKPEEDYLERAFGLPYLQYKAKVRRWL